MRLIDADALAEDLLYDAELCVIALDSGEITDRKELDRLQFEKDCKQNCVWYLADAPTVDAVPVVRCKDCKWYQESNLLAPNKFCFRLKGKDGEKVGYNFADDDFCSHGERKGGDE